MARLTAPIDLPSGPAAQGPVRPSIWASVHPRLLELIRSHRSTLLFVNSRRLAERLAGSLNELAEEPLVRSHHGSLARAARSEVEDLLKAGRIKALVATSSLELGIDMGAIDLVVQIEAPPSVASGLQRIGRAGHQAGAVSEGIIFPKFRGDLVACAAVARAMHEGRVESTRYPRNPLDVLAQQIVAMVGARHLVGGRVVCGRETRCAVRRLEPAGVRGRARHALGTLSLRRVRRAAAARHVGSPAGTPHGRDRREACGHRQRGNDSRSRAVRRLPRRRRSADPRGRAGRGDGLRDRSRRDVHARRIDVARRRDHARSRAGVARAGRAGQDAVLARRSGGPSGGARLRDRQAGARAARHCRRPQPSIGW